jgi:hypothetical protein
MDKAFERASIIIYFYKAILKDQKGRGLAQGSNVILI